MFLFGGTDTYVKRFWNFGEVFKGLKLYTVIISVEIKASEIVKLSATFGYSKGLCKKSSQVFCHRVYSKLQTWNFWLIFQNLHTISFQTSYQTFLCDMRVLNLAKKWPKNSDIIYWRPHKVIFHFLVPKKGSKMKVLRYYFFQKWVLSSLENIFLFQHW